MQAVLTVLSAAGLIRDALKVAVGLALALFIALAFTLASLAALVGGAGSPAALPALVAPAAGAPLAPAIGAGPGRANALPASALAALPTFNQYDAGNYASRAAWARWKDASCSAASLLWLLRAYGVPLQTIDQVVALIGDGTGISPALGLLDASGRPLARAISSLGLAPRNANIGRSPAALQAWLDQGPLALDGAAWYGSGHWFVAYAYDAGGVFTRDSSGHDVRYLTWAQLYGAPAGFSGNVVGIGGGAPSRG